MRWLIWLMLAASLLMLAVMLYYYVRFFARQPVAFGAATAGVAWLAWHRRAFAHLADQQANVRFCLAAIAVGVVAQLASYAALGPTPGGRLTLGWALLGAVGLGGSIGIALVLMPMLGYIALLSLKVIRSRPAA